MSFFAGLAGGLGEAQGQYNQKMLDFYNQKSQTMANLYGHLADTVLQNGDPYNIAPSLFDRSMQWTQAHPLFNPKGYKDLLKSEKGGLHSIVDEASQRQISDYHRQQFGGGGDTSFTPRPSDAVPLGGTEQPSSQPPQPAMGVAPSMGQGPVGTAATAAGFAGGGAIPQPTTAAPVTPPAPTTAAPAQPTPQAGPSFGGGTSATPFQIPNMQDLMTQLTGGQPMYGELGTLTPMGKMAMSVVPDVMKQRMEMQYKMSMIGSVLKNSGQDPRSPSGSAMVSEMMRSMGINWPVTQWRPEDVLLRDENGRPFITAARQSFRDQSHWMTSGPGQESEIFPEIHNPRVQYAKDGSAWVMTSKGLEKLDGRIPIQTGTSSTRGFDPYGRTEETQTKRFSQGVPGVAAGGPPTMPIPGQPTVGVTLPPGLNSGGIDQGPPTARTSTKKPSEAYKRTGTFSLEQLERSNDPVDNQIAGYITHPESYLDPGPGRRDMWNMEFSRRTNGAVNQAPVPMRVLGSKFHDQRVAIVNGFEASKNISNILNASDGRIVGMVTGKIYDLLNSLGSAKGINFLDKFEKGDAELPPGMSQQALDEVAKENPAIAHFIQSGKGNELAMKAADLITTMRLFNFADVRNTIGGVQGVSRVYQFLKSSLMNPGMDLPLVLSHLSSLNRNMADGLLTLEQARWGPKIPYIREKELMSKLYFDSHVEGQLQAVQSSAAQKGITLSRQDALFLLWRSGKIEADPGKYQVNTNFASSAGSTQ